MGFGDKKVYELQDGGSASFNGVRNFFRRLGDSEGSKMADGWGYEVENGPHEWVKKYPVAAGKRQSPIDIVTEEAKPASFTGLTLTYADEKDMVVTNTGHSIMAKMEQTSVMFGGPLSATYKLEQFHLHWGSEDDKGSEHTIDSKCYPAELHLVHWNSNSYRSFAEAADKPDGLAVLGFMVKIGNVHTEFQKITDVIPTITENGASEKIDKFNPRELITDLKEYWTYEGSLTTPPLHESVTWIVFKEPIQISKDQMASLRLLKGGNGKPMCNNYRPPVELNDRVVRSSFSA